MPVWKAVKGSRREEMKGAVHEVRGHRPPPGIKHASIGYFQSTERRTKPSSRQWNGRPVHQREGRRIVAEFIEILLRKLVDFELRTRKKRHRRSRPVRPEPPPHVCSFHPRICVSTSRKTDKHWF